MKIFGGGTIVRQSAHCFRQFSVGSHYSASVAQCAEVFSGIKTECGSHAPTADGLATDDSTVGLGGVFHKEQAVLASQLREFRHRRRKSVEMNRK